MLFGFYLAKSFQVLAISCQSLFLNLSKTTYLLPYKNSNCILNSNYDFNLEVLR